MVQQNGPVQQRQQPRLLEQVREVIRARHYSLRTRHVCPVDQTVYSLS